MRTFVLICLSILLGICNVQSQNLQDLQDKQTSYVKEKLDLPYTYDIKHAIEHAEEDFGRALTLWEKQDIVVTYYNAEFVGKNKDLYELAGLKTLPSFGKEECVPNEKNPTSCLNGGFEDGFDHYLARWADGYTDGGNTCTPNVTYNAYQSPNNADQTHFAVVDNSAMDPIVPILNRVEFDSRAGRINSHLASTDPNPFLTYNREVDQLVKKFYVTDQTADFTMHYAVVLQNPTGHNNGQPFFHVEILEGPDYVNTIYDFCFDAENDNELVTYSGQNKFKNWSCLQVNLEEYIDCPVMLRVTTADCDAGGHFGYSYVDGICEPCGTGGDPLVFIKEVGPCEDNSVKITGVFETPPGYDLSIIQLNGPNLEVLMGEFDIDYTTNSFCVTLTEQDYIDAGITDCAEIVITGIFSNGTDLITSVSAPVEICLSDLQCDSCLVVTIGDIECLNNGTSDPSDDHWTFEITVTSNLDPSCNYWIADGDYIDAGPMNDEKLVFMGPISNYGSTIEFYVFDACDKECGEKIIIEVPKDCSAPCKLEAEVLKVGDCKDDGSYGVQVDVSGSDDQCWMAVMKKENGDEVVVGTYSGDGIFDLGPFNASDGNFVLWIKLCDYFDCVLDIYVFAPECCLDVDITNVMCLNNGTSDPSDDQWTFDIEVSSNSDESCGYWKSDGDVDEAGSLNNVKTIWMGQISDYGSTVSFTVFDGCDEDCFMDITIDVPESCSPDCKLELKDYEVGECKEGNQFYINATVVGTDGDCWMAKIKKADGTEEVIGTYFGDGTYQLGPFDADEGNFTLWIKMCDQFDCLLDVYIFAPDCEGFGIIGAREATSSSTLAIYPNPNVGEFTLELGSEQAISIITLTDISGKQIIMKYDQPSNVVKFNNIDLANGVYFVTAETTDKEIIHGKFIKI